MVHVWSINSGERFQGHHGPLVFVSPFPLIYSHRISMIHISEEMFHNSELFLECLFQQIMK